MDVAADVTEIVGSPVAVGSDGSTVNVGRVVKVGRGVRVSVAVGGGSVLDGCASWVWATTVNAPASAVCWISCGFIVGVACGTHALTNKINTTPTINRFLFIDGYILNCRD